MSLIEDLKWRHACKGMNGAKVPQDAVERILEAINQPENEIPLPKIKYKQNSLSIDKRNRAVRLNFQIIKGKRARLPQII